MTIHFKKVGLSYPDLDVLTGVDLSFPDGSVTAVLGPSGCGKTSLLGLAAGILTPTQGKVVIESEHPPHFGLMRQKDHLLEWKTLEENAALGLLARGYKDDEALKTVQKQLREFGLEGFGSYYPRQLSGGMRQRASLLRAWLASPDALLLDEPLSALDALLRRRLQFWLDEMFRGHRATVILVTHSVDEALLLGSRLALIQGRPGRVTLVEDLPFAGLPAIEREKHSGWQSFRSELFSRLDQESFDTNGPDLL